MRDARLEFCHGRRRANSGSSPVLDREGSRLLAIGGKLIELCCGALNYYRAFCWIQPT